jgi:hypothetical protein
MVMSDSKKSRDTHEQALKSFNESYTASYDEREQARADRRFATIPGAMWEGNLGERFKNRPKFEFNKIEPAVNRVLNDYRQNRIAPIFTSKDGQENDELADLCAGLYRADEQDSGSDEALDNAFEEGLHGGMGAWRLTTRYEDEEDDEDDRQRIVFEPIFDADKCVFFNVDSKKQDKRDAKECWVLSSMSYDAFVEEYKEDPATWPNSNSNTGFDWHCGSTVYIAEYYKVEGKKETLVTYRGLLGKEDEVTYTQAEIDDDETLRQQLEATGYKVARQKTVMRKKIHKYIMSGSGILEDCGIIAGNRIPIIVFYGKRWFVDNIERFKGIVRNAKDQSRLDNLLRSRLAEISASSSVEKPIFTPKQVGPHGLMWSEDNIKNYPYVLLEPTIDENGNESIPPIQYTRSPQIPPALSALLMTTDQDRKDILGDQAGSEQTAGNVSGRAVELTQQALDSRSYIYISNFGKAIKCCAEIWLGMARDVYVEDGRKMKTIPESGDASYAELNRPMLDDAGGEFRENDVSQARFDVSVDVGPSSSSKRQASVRELMGLAAVEKDPQNASVISQFILMNMEGEGLSDLNAYARKKLVSQGIVPPTEDEKKELEAAAANQQPDPQAEYLKAAAQNETAKAVKAQADTMLTAAKVEETRTKVAEMLVGIDASKQQQVLDLIQTLQGLSQEGQSTTPNQAGESKGVSDE